MSGFFGLLVLGGIIGLIVYYVNKNKQEKEKEAEIKRKLEKEKKEKELKEFEEKWERKKIEILSQGLPIVDSTTLNLTKNEICHFQGEACFCKIKNQTVGYEGGSRGVSFRVMKGVSFRVGNYQGHYVKEEITEKTNGIIYLTNKKIIFTSIKNSCTVNYSDIINLNAEKNMLQIQTNKKSFLFQIVDSFNFMLVLECIINNTEENE